MACHTRWENDKEKGGLWCWRGLGGGGDTGYEGDPDEITGWID